MQISGPFSRLVVAAIGVVVSGIGAASDLFDVQRFEDPGRTIIAELVDLDGDGRSDLVQIVMRGIPPEEKRFIRVRLQSADGKLRDEADFELPMPEGAAAYDIADLRSAPGDELLLLRRHDLLILSLASVDAPRWSLPISGGTSVGAGEDERGLERMRMVFEVSGDRPWILATKVPVSPTSSDVPAPLTLRTRHS